MGHESQIEPWSPNLTTFCFVGFGTDRLRREQTMKTAGRENPNHAVAWPRNRAHGAVGQNTPRSIKWAEKQEKFQPKEMCFFLTSTFIELTRSVAHRGEHQLVRIVAEPVAWATKPVRVRRRKRKHRLFNRLEFFDHTRWKSSIARRKHIANDRRRQSCRFNRWM
jgi:hypothetical protein